MDLIVMEAKPVVPGVRFHPSEEELFMYYLKRKVMGKSFPCPMMAEVDVYRFAPWDLPNMSCLKTKDLNWYFFCPRAKKYASGSRANRATEYGYWKSTGNDRSVQYNGRHVGKIKTLIFHRGKPPKGDRTDWVMYEYRLEDQLLADNGVSQDSYVICKIYQKGGRGPKNGEHYGAPFVEEEWESDDDGDNVQNDQGCVLHPENDVPADDMSASSTPGGLAPSSTEQLTPSITAAWTSSATTERSVPTTEQAATIESLADGLGETVDDDFFEGLPDLNSAGFIEMDDFSKSLHDFDWSQLQLPDDLPVMELNDLN